MKLIPQDYHLHSRFSPDSEMAMETVCRQAVAMGIGEICFTDHVDFLPKDADPQVCYSWYLALMLG